MSTKTLLTILLFMILSCNSNDKLNYENYSKAINNQSTLQNFIVIKVKNINTNEIKEVCTKGNFLLGAIHLELDKKYDVSERKEVVDFAASKTDRYFEFKNTEALKNVSFDNYNEAVLNDTEISSTVKLIEDKLKVEKSYTLKLNSDEMIAIAHQLFKKGYLTAENSCFGGKLLCYQKISD